MAPVFSIRPAADDEMTTVAALFREYGAKLGIDLSYQGFEAEVTSLPGGYAPPRGALLLAVDKHGTAFGCVGVRPLSRAASCELKRLYVRDEWRGRGAGRALATAAIAAARRAAYEWIYLDTLATMSEAQALYRDLGFAKTDAYYNSQQAGTVYMRRNLTVSAGG